MKTITFQWDEEKNNINQKKQEHKRMESEYDLAKMQKRPNPFAQQLKKQVSIALAVDVIEYFEKMA